MTSAQGSASPERIATRLDVKAVCPVGHSISYFFVRETRRSRSVGVCWTWTTFLGEKTQTYARRDFECF